MFILSVEATEHKTRSNSVEEWPPLEAGRLWLSLQPLRRTFGVTSKNSYAGIR